MAIKITYNECVKKALKLVSLLKLKTEHRMQIAALACKAVQIKHGGKVPGDKFTLSKFANKIGINRKTLSEWTRQYRYVYLKLDADRKDKYIELSSDSAKNVIKNIDKDSSPTKVRKQLDTVYRKGPVTNKFLKYCGVLKTLIYHVGNHQRIIIIENDALFEIVKDCRTLIAFIEKEVDLREGKIPAKFNRPKINFDDFWTEEIQIN